MNRLSRALVLVVAGVAVGCPLTPYPSGEIPCEVSGVACPTDYTCVDPVGRGPRCYRVGCGDGLPDPGREECDDANDNEFDLCSSDCKAHRYLAETGDIIGLGPGGGRGRETPMGRPVVIAADPAGNVYASSTGLNVIMRLTPEGTESYAVAAIAGSGTVIGSLGVDAAVRPDQISTPFVTSMTVDSFGNIYVGDLQDNMVRRIDALTGFVEVIAGNGTRESFRGEDVDARDGGLDIPVGVTTDGDGLVYFAERGPQGVGHQRIRRVDPETKVVRTIFDSLPGQLRLEGAPINDLAFDQRGRLHLFQARVDVPRGPIAGSTDRLVDVHIVIRTIDPRTPDAAPVVHRLVVATERRRADGVTVVSAERAFPGIASNQSTFSTEDGRFFYVVMDNQIFELDAGDDAVDGDDSLMTARQVAVVPDAVDADGDGLFSPGEDGKPSLLSFTFKPTDTAVVGRNLFVSDPGNKVVWRFNPKVRVVADVNADVAAGRPPAPRSVKVVDVVAEIAVAFGEESDGHVNVGASDDCGAVNPLDGNAIEFFVAFPDLHRVVFSNCNSSIAVVAGVGRPGRTEAGLAREFQLDTPTSLIRIERIGANGKEDDAFYIADRNNHRIVRVRNKNPDAVQSPLIAETFIGGATATAPGAAKALSLRFPSSVALEESPPKEEGGPPLRRLLIADTGNHRVLRVDLDSGAVTTVVGTGVAGFNGDDQRAAATRLDEPTGLVVLPLGLINVLAELNDTPLPVQLTGSLLVISERSGNRIRGVFTPPIGIFPEVLTLAGDGVAGDVDSADDGRAGRVRLPRGVMFAVPDVENQQLGFLIVDAIDRIRELRLSFDLASLELSTSLVTPAHGDLPPPPPPSRDDGPRDAARFRGPSAVAFVDQARALVADRASGRLRLVYVETGDVVTVTGMNDGVSVDGAGQLEALTAAPMASPAGIAIQDDVTPPVAWVSEADIGRLRRFTLHDPEAPETWTTDEGVAPEALVTPEGLAWVDGALYIADAGAHAIFRMDPSSGRTTVVAGVPGRRGAFGDGGPATEALLNEPSGVAVRGDVILIADTGNHRVRRVDPRTATPTDGPDDGEGEDDEARGPVISTILGNGEAASAGEGKGASGFPVARPRGIAIDVAGNVVVTTGTGLRFIEAGALLKGESVLVANDDDAVATIYGRAPRETFPEAVTRCVDGVALSPPQATSRVVAGAPTQVFDRQRVVAVDGCLGTVIPLRRVTTGATEQAAALPQAAP